MHGPAAKRGGSARQLPFVGCAGWSIPAAHRAKFLPGDSVLAQYATRFDAVEINSSFYRSHQPKTYARWADTVPGQFRFAVKMRRTITHEARLHHADTEIAGFFDEVAALGTRLGVVLVQLPPSLRFDAAVAEDFFERVRRRFEGAIALEPRHRSWFDSEAEAVCIDHRIARVAADPAPVPLPAAALPGGAAEPRYWRWHGSPRIYYSAYGEARLRGLAEATANGDPERSWCIFDNTAQGHAIADALKLRDLFERAVSPHEALRA